MSAIFQHSVTVCHRLVWAMVLLLVVSCSGLQPGQEAYTSDGTTIQSAQSRLAIAATAQSPQKEQLYVEAAELFAENNAYLQALDALRLVNARNLKEPFLTRYVLVSAQVAMANEDYETANTLLSDNNQTVDPATLTLEKKQQWYRLRGDLFALMDRDARSIEEYATLSGLLQDRQQIQQIHDLIWQQLIRMPETRLETAFATTNDVILGGWFELGLLTSTSRGNIDRQMSAIQSWYQENPSHPATLIPPTSLRQATIAAGNLPNRVAVLLPLSGELAQASQALRDGLLAAYYRSLESGGHHPQLHFYDTENLDIAQVYQQAVDDQVDLVIGPLRKEHLETLMLLPQLPVPVLGLNAIEDIPNEHQNLFQFSLSVADEAQQAAERAWHDGNRAMLVITPTTNWGTTARDTFINYWHSKGGRTLNIDYNQGTLDYAPLLKPPLLVQQSEERAKRLERLLGKNLEFTPRRRRDYDGIFVATYGPNGRQIKPTLDFLYAADMPIYSTSQLYDGTTNPALDRDLNGIHFTALPSNLETLSGKTMAPAATLAPAYRQLFAMGIDSYRLHQWLELMRNLPVTELSGLTGSLRLGPENRIRRTLPWAYFTPSGQVRLVSTEQ